VNELTDLEICQRIAEIEGKSYWLHGTGEGICMNYIEGKRDSKVLYYNPLTDDALCFKLMIKYKISLIQHQNNTAVYCIWDHDEKHATNTMTNPNLAVCLAIIKSKE
jgi:hypothetical protein